MLVALKNMRWDGGDREWHGERGGVGVGPGRFGCSRRRVLAWAGSLGW